MTKSAFVAILEELMSLPLGALKESDTRATVSGWSSLVDVQIVSLVSEQFGFEMDEELLEYDSIGCLLAILENKQAFRTSKSTC